VTGDYEDFHEYSERYPLLRQALQLKEYIFEKGGKQWASVLDVESALELLEELAETPVVAGVRAAILNGTHLFVYSVASPWYARNKVILAEQFFLRIAPGDSKGAYEAIEALASDFEATHIVMATALAKDDARLGMLYEAQGYTQQSTQYVKEAAWLQSVPS